MKDRSLTTRVDKGLAERRDPVVTRITFRPPVEVKKRLQAAADGRGVSVNELLVVMVETFLDG